jgi:phosphoribosylcarboxyaminoimidazole (NCAIR) mutase
LEFPRNWVVFWRFPVIGVPLNHPFLQDVPYCSTINLPSGVSPFMETLI